MRRRLLLLGDLCAVVAVIAAVVVGVQRLDGAGAPAQPREVARQPEPTATPERPPLPPADDCKRKGITRAEGGEGACYEPSGRRVRVVNRSSRLDLAELAAELRDIDVRRQPARRRATVTVRVRLRNKADGIVDFRASQAGLLLGRSLFRADAAKETARPGSLVRRAAALGEREAAEGSIRFVVPLRALPRLDRDGNLQILQFSDASFASASATVGIFRTYR